MKFLPIYLFSFLLSFAACAQNNDAITAGMDRVRLEFKLDASGRPVYAVYYDGKPVIKPSVLGIKLVDAPGLDEHFTVTGTDKKTMDEQWTPVWGEVSHIRNHYEQLTVHLKQQSKEALA